jgi:hypothetical protein
VRLGVVEERWPFMDGMVRNVLECQGCDVLPDDPVFFPTCCHVCCRGCAKIKMGYLVACPLCGEISSSVDIKPVPVIAQLVSEIRKLDARTGDEEAAVVEKAVVEKAVVEKAVVEKAPVRRRQEPRAVKKAKKET